MLQKEIHSLEEDHILIIKELIGFHKKEEIMWIEFLAEDITIGQELIPIMAIEILVVIIYIGQTVGIDNIKGES